MYEIIATIANLSALTVIGFIYLAYIKNLRSINQLNESQLKLSEQNVKLWKDKALELERKSPEFIEKQLSERIKIREEELLRLAKDTKNHSEEIDQKNKEIEALKQSIEKANQFRTVRTVWDRESDDYVQVHESQLEHKFIGSVCVDTASLMICDPFYLKINEDNEKQNCLVQKYKYQVIDTHEYFCTSNEDEAFDSELLGLGEDMSIKELESTGKVKRVEYGGELPAIETSYIKSNVPDPVYKKIKHFSFLNGRLGAGIGISLMGDGCYPIYIEYYKNDMQRIIIEV